MRPLLLVLLVALTASCAGPGSSAPDTESPARVGAVEPAPAASPSPLAEKGHDESAEETAEQPEVAVLGPLGGSNIGEVFGSAGLGLSGIGSGDDTTGGLGLGTAGGSGWGTGRVSDRSSADRSGLSLDTGAATVTGDLDREVIRRVIAQHRPRLGLCYQRELARDPRLQGKLTVRFVIGPEGTVPQATSTVLEIANPALVGCVLSTFRAMRFPKPGSGIVTVTYPLLFRAASTEGDAGAPIGDAGVPRDASTDAR